MSGQSVIRRLKLYVSMAVILSGTRRKGLC